MVAGTIILITAPAAAAPPDTKTEKDEMLWLLGGGLRSAVRFETADKSAKLEILHRSSKTKPVWGLSLKAGVENDLGLLFSGGTVAPKAEATARAGWVNLATRSDDSSGAVDWFIVRLSGTGQKIVLYDASAPFAKQIDKRVFGAPGIEIRYGSFLGEQQLLLSIFGRVERDNNFATLGEVEVTTERSDTSSGVTRKAQSKVTARTGTYLERTAAPMGFELFHKLPTELLGVSLSVVVKSMRHERPEYHASGGLFLLKKGRPAQSVAGVTVAFDDLGRGPLEDQFSVGLVLNVGVGP
jgi:hypothetical protein